MSMGSRQVLHNLKQRPQKKLVQTYMNNLRKRDAAVKGLKKGKRSQDTWNLADFQLLAEKMKKVSDKDEHDKNRLLLVGAHLADEHLVVTFTNPVLVQSIWQRVKNRAFIKIGTDGVYKLTNQNYTFACIGLLVKDSEPVGDRNEDSKLVFPTTYKEMMYAVMRSEHGTTYGRVFQDFDVTMKEILGIENFHSLVGQVHGDYHTGLLAAAQRHYRHVEWWDRVRQGCHWVGPGWPVTIDPSAKEASVDTIPCYALSKGRLFCVLGTRGS